jgi:hypothetical protein
MSFNDYKPAWKVKGLTSKERLVLLALAEHRNGNEKDENFNLCCPGYTLLIEETGMSRGSVSSAINGLKTKLPLNVAVDPNNRLSNRYFFPWNEEGGCSIGEHPVHLLNTLFPNGTPCSPIEQSVPQVDYNKESNQESKKEENTEYNSSAAADISSTSSQDELRATEIHLLLGQKGKPDKSVKKLLPLLQDDSSRDSVDEVLSHPLLISKLKKMDHPVDALIDSVKKGYAKDWIYKAVQIEFRKAATAPPAPASPPTDYRDFDLSGLDE